MNASEARAEATQVEQRTGAAITFEGFGGSTVSLETRVYTVNSCEVRIPQHPDAFPRDKVASAYLCIAADSLDEAVRCIQRSRLFGRIKPRHRSALT